MKTVVVGSLLLAAVAVLQPAAAQSPISFEVTGGGALPTQTLGGAELGRGVGFGANLRYRVMPHLAVYGGWEWHHTQSDELITDTSIDVEDTGYTFGLRFEHPLTAGTAYWLRAGGLVNHLELEDDAGVLVADSKHGLGWEAGAGLTVPLAGRFALTPGVRYRTLSRDLEIGGVTESRTLSYVTLGTGVVFTF